MARKHPAERRQQDSVVRPEARPPDLAAENRQFVAKHEDLELLGSIPAAEEHDELQQTADDDVEGGHKQRQPPADGDADATAGSAALAPRLIEYLHPTASQRGKRGPHSSGSNSKRSPTAAARSSLQATITRLPQQPTLANPCQM